MERKTLFTDVIVPLAVPQWYTYRVPAELNDSVGIGFRVIVQFGKNKLYTGIIKNIHSSPPRHYEAKYIEAVLDSQQVINDIQLQFWEWMSAYYCCNPGDVMNAAVPGSLRLASETKIVLSQTFNRDYEKLKEKEYTIVSALEARESMTLKEIGGILQQKTVQPLVKSLLEKNVVMMEEEVKQKYKPRFEIYLDLSKNINTEEKLQEVFAGLEKDKRAARQTDALMLFLHLNQRYSNYPSKVKKSDLVKQFEGSQSAIDTLIKKNILEEFHVRTDRLEKWDRPVEKTYDLSPEQQQAYDSIKNHWKEKEVVLLHGITSSGKTEVYIKLIEEIIEKKQQVLYLLPEIALTSQIINRLRKFFGDQVGIYHSRFNDQERAEIWAKTLKGDYKILLGARSALFLPFAKLGLVIVDEEHENTFKQFDPAPRYHARDAAILMASLFKAKTLLGSATPSIESYYNAKNGKFGLAELKTRFGGVMLPEIQCVDIKEATKKKTMRSLFSETLIEHIRTALDNKEQVILFQNRRGYSPFWMCEMCGWSPRCKHCDVSLTYHKFTHQLQCHYCATVYSPNKVCAACGSHKLKMMGFGTEKIEEELEILIPGIRIKRMDLDSTRSKNAYFDIINDFEDRKTDVLVGTQMVTKGLDFDNVALVGILNADQLLNYPDFRAFERSFQLLAQVAGRAGRKEKRGKVLIQTYRPDHWVIQKVMQNDYEALYKEEIIERRNFAYPPFVRLIEITLKHKDEQKLADAAKFLSQQLKKELDKRILGPEKPAVGKINNYYLRKIMVKLERNNAYNPRKELVKEKVTELKQHPEFKSVWVEMDVDPV